jgi:hypothetical protein
MIKQNGFLILNSKEQAALKKMNGSNVSVYGELKKYFEKKLNGYRGLVSHHTLRQVLRKKDVRSVYNIRDRFNRGKLAKIKTLGRKGVYIDLFLADKNIRFLSLNENETLIISKGLEYVRTDN